MNARLSPRVGLALQGISAAEVAGRDRHERDFAKQAPLAPMGHGEPGRVGCAGHRQCRLSRGRQA